MKRTIILALAGSMIFGPAWSDGLTGPIGGGGGGGGGSGTVTSLTATCGLAATPSPITATGSYGASTTVNPQAGTNYPIVSGDCGKLVNLSNASNQIPTIPSGATLGAGWATEVCNQGAGTQTITPAGGTIGGAATYVLAAGTAAAPKCVGIVSDGTNLQLDMTGVGGGGTPGGTSGQLQTNNGSGGFGAVAAPSGAVVGTSDSQTLTNKSIDGAEINSGTVPAARSAGLTGDCTSTAGAIATTCNYFHPGFITNNWYYPLSATGSLTTGTTFTASTIYCRYNYIPQTVTIGTVAVNFTTLGAAGNLQVAYYTNNTSHLPGTLITNTASISTGATGNVQGALGANIQIGPGGTNGTRDIWMCVNIDNATAILTAISTAGTSMGAYMGSSVLATLMPGNTTIDSISCSGANCNGGSSTFGTWPTLTGSTWTYNNTQSRFPVIAFKVVSSP